MDTLAWINAAWAKARRFTRPPRTLQFTKEGKYFVGLTFGIGVAAINSGNNLLYLLLGMMLSLIIASGVLSEMSLRGLQVVRQSPFRVHAHEPFLMGIDLTNDKRRLPSFSIEVEEMVSERLLDKKCYFLKLPAGRKQQTSYRHTFDRRGRVQFTGVRLSTKFPFGLFRKSRRIDLENEILVLPQLLPITQLLQPGGFALGQDTTAEKKGRRGEFHGLREFKDGDEPRDIHWRSSARKGRQMVREYEDENARRVMIYLDNALPGGVGCTDPIALGALERAISLAASLAADYLHRGFTLRLITRGEQTMWCNGQEQLLHILRRLALLRPCTVETPFASPPDPRLPPIWVVRRGEARAPFGQVLEV